MVPGAVPPCLLSPRPPADGALHQASHNPQEVPDPCCPEYGPGMDIIQTTLLHDIDIPGIGLCEANLRGRAKVVRGLPYVDPLTGLCCVEVEMVSLLLQGTDPVCGEICITLDPSRPSRGRICNQTPGGPCFPAESCFEMFVEVEMPNLGITLKNCAPVRVCCGIDAVPPFNCFYQLGRVISPVPLYTPADCANFPDPTGVAQPIGIVEAARHVPRNDPDPPCCPEYGPRTDKMFSRLAHNFDLFGIGLLCTANVKGPVWVETGVPYTKTDPVTGVQLCCVSTRMTKLELSGVDPVCGPITIRLCPDRPTRGEICECEAGTCFPADSWFDVYLEIEVMGMIFKNCKPAKMHCKIDMLPPYDCAYVLDLQGVDLYKKDDLTGIFDERPCDDLDPSLVVGTITDGSHRPEPCPPLTIECLESPVTGVHQIIVTEDPDCPCDGEIVLIKRDEGGNEAEVCRGTSPLTCTDIPCDGFAARPQTVTYCAYCEVPSAVAGAPPHTGVRRCAAIRSIVLRRTVAASDPAIATRMVSSTFRT